MHTDKHEEVVGMAMFDIIITETCDFFKKIFHFDVLWFILASEAQDLSHNFLFHLKAREKRTKENIFSKKGYFLQK